MYIILDSSDAWKLSGIIMLWQLPKHNACYPFAARYGMGPELKLLIISEEIAVAWILQFKTLRYSP